MILVCSLDRKILRFLRGNGHSIDKVCELMTKFLSWRDAQGVDQIRENILRGGMNHPSKFPNGEKVIRTALFSSLPRNTAHAVILIITSIYCCLIHQILAMVPQIVIAPYCCDKNGSPICVDQYNVRHISNDNSCLSWQSIVFLIWLVLYWMILLSALVCSHTHTEPLPLPLYLYLAYFILLKIHDCKL